MARTLRAATPLALLVFFVLLGTGPARAGGPANTVRWGGTSSSNMASPARNLPADPLAVTPLLELELGTHQYTIPTVDRGRIYLGINDTAIDRPGVKRTGGGILLSLEQPSGKLIWQLPSPRYFEGMTEPYHFNQWKCGFCSGPVVDGDRVFVIGGRGEILCLDRDGQSDGNDGPFLEELAYIGASGSDGAKLLPTDGDIIWRYNLIAEVDVVPHDVCGSTLLLLDDFLYASTSNGLDGRHDKMAEPRAPSLIVLEKTTGRLVAVERQKIGTRTLHGTWSSPSYGVVRGRPLVFFGGGDGVLYAFEPIEEAPAEGDVVGLRMVWQHDCNPADYRARDGEPVPYSRHNRRSPEGPSEIIGTPVFHQGRVYVAIGQSPLHGVGQGQLSCVDAATGNEVWASRLVDRSLATVSIAGGLVYVVDFSGSLHAFDALTGEREWVHDMGAGAWSASTFVADGKVYASTEANTLWVLAAGREKHVLSQRRLKSMAITPTAVDGILYLPTQKRLIALPGGSVSAGAERRVGG